MQASTLCIQVYRGRIFVASTLSRREVFKMFTLTSRQIVGSFQLHLHVSYCVFFNEINFTPGVKNAAFVIHHEHPS